MRKITFKIGGEQVTLTDDSDGIAIIIEGMSDEPITFHASAPQFLDTLMDAIVPDPKDSPFTYAMNKSTGDALYSGANRPSFRQSMLMKSNAWYNSMYPKKD